MRVIRRMAHVGSIMCLGGLLSTGCVATPPLSGAGRDITVPSTLVTEQPIAKVEQSMVRFRTIMCGGEYAGSGFAIDAHTLVTNRHVVGGADTIEADTWDGRPLHITKVQISPDNDLAVVSVSNTLTHTVPLAKSDPVTHLPVWAVGYPLGLALRADQGKVIEMVTSDQSTNDQFTNYGEPRAILYDARTRHGNSGGPLVNKDGTAVGIVYRLFSLEDNTSLAIPATTLRKVLDDKDLVANPDCQTFIRKYEGA